jgi:hypothetical protein
VLDLLRNVLAGWEGNELLRGYLEEGSGWWQSWEGSDFGGKRLSILRPVVRFRRGETGEDEEGVTPEWKTPSVPYAKWAKEDVAFGVS